MTKKADLWNIIINTNVSKQVMACVVSLMVKIVTPVIAALNTDIGKTKEYCTSGCDYKYSTCW
jgi:hypothetical protein